VINVDFTV